MTSALFGPDGTQPPAADGYVGDALAWPPGPLLGPVAGPAGIDEPLGHIELPPVPDAAAILRQYREPLTPPEGMPAVAPQRQPQRQARQQAQRPAAQQAAQRQAAQVQRQAAQRQAAQRRAAEQQAAQRQAQQALAQRQAAQWHAQQRRGPQQAQRQAPAQRPLPVQAQQYPNQLAPIPQRPATPQRRQPKPQPQPYQPPKSRSNNTIGCVVTLIFIVTVGFNYVTDLIGLLIDAFR